MAYIATDVISINPSTSFLHNLFCLSHWLKPQGKVVAFGHVGMTVSGNVVGFGWLGLAGPKSMHMKLRGDLCSGEAAAKESFLPPSTTAE